MIHSLLLSGYVVDLETRTNADLPNFQSLQPGDFSKKPLKACSFSSKTPEDFNRSLLPQ